MSGVLDILDPEGKGVAPFYINEFFNPELGTIREAKKAIEGAWRTEAGAHRQEELKVERLSVVAKEHAAEEAVRLRLAEQLRPYISMFRHNILSIARLDFRVQKALLAFKHGAVRPEVGGQHLEFKGLWNPEVAMHLKRQGGSFVPIAIDLHQGVALLTGANMAGKSVALRTLLLNICLAQMGFLVFAASAAIPLFDGFYLLGDDLQSTSSGLSSFAAEVVLLNEVIERTKSGFLFIAMDEFARGTNPEEGAVIVSEVAKFLNKQGSITILTTHYDITCPIDISRFQVVGLSGLDWSLLAARSAYGSPNGIKLIAEHMDYRLVKVEGATSPSRDALNICRMLNLDEAILTAFQSRIYNVKNSP
jgi:hypothetical protein